jgi:hypothetical protein
VPQLFAKNAGVLIFGAIIFTEKGAVKMNHSAAI